MVPFLLPMTSPPGCGSSTVSTRPVCGCPTAVPVMLTLTCLVQVPRPGVCAATVSVAGPPGSALPGTTASNPDFAQYPLPVTFATSGRLPPTLPFANTRSPCSTCTPSTPAQPSADVSTTQPLTWNGAPTGMLDPAWG